MNYTDFLKMIPEAVLTAILVITFICDFASARQTERKWMNPLVSVMFAALTAICSWIAIPTTVPFTLRLTGLIS